MGTLTGKRVIMIVAPEQFRDEEYFQPKVVLQAAGATVETAAATKEEEATGTKGGKAKIDKPLGKVKAADYEGVIFVGGEGAKKYFRDKQVLELAKSFYSAGKVIGAICIAPAILANAGLLRGKKVSVFPSQEKTFLAKGAKLSHEPVTIDGTIVTARDAEAALEFGQKLNDALGKS